MIDIVVELFENVGYMQQSFC